MLTNVEDTIAAIATPIGPAGIGIIRVSGKKSTKIAFSIFKKELKERVACLFSFKDPKNNNFVDQVIVIFFKGPRSFTGEDIVEIHSHGGTANLNRILTIILHEGARLAEPGEFSKRAYINGKIDISQAEAVSDLIHAKTEASAQAAARVMQGFFSQKTKEISKKILNLRMHIEAFLNFPEEDLDELDKSRFLKELIKVKEDIDKIHQQGEQGALLQEGAIVAILGKPNAGKSTMINTLAKKEVAIVSEEPGTTRDLVEVEVLLNSCVVKIVDTAGIRETNSYVEKKGIEKAFQVCDKSNLIIYARDIQDLTNSLKEDEHIKNYINQFDKDKNKKILHVFTKCDLINKNELEKIKKELSDQNVSFISSFSEETIRELINKIEKLINYVHIEDSLSIKKRHLDTLKKAVNHVEKSIQLFQLAQSELVAEELNITHDLFKEMTGKVTSDELLGEIFSNFCIGK